MNAFLFGLLVIIGVALTFLIVVMGITMLHDFIKERKDDKRRQNPSDE